MYQFLDVEEFSPVRVIATVAKSYLHSPTPCFEGIEVLTKVVRMTPTWFNEKFVLVDCHCRPQVNKLFIGKLVLVMVHSSVATWSRTQFRWRHTTSGNSHANFWVGLQVEQRGEVTLDCPLCQHKVEWYRQQWYCCHPGSPTLMLFHDFAERKIKAKIWNPDIVRIWTLIPNTKPETLILT